MSEKTTQEIVVDTIAGAAQMLADAQPEEHQYMVVIQFGVTISREGPVKDAEIELSDDERGLVYEALADAEIADGYTIEHDAGECSQCWKDAR